MTVVVVVKPIQRGRDLVMNSLNVHMWHKTRQSGVFASCFSTPHTETPSSSVDKNSPFTLRVLNIFSTRMPFKSSLMKVWTKCYDILEIDSQVIGSDYYPLVFFEDKSFCFSIHYPVISQLPVHKNWYIYKRGVAFTKRF